MEFSLIGRHAPPLFSRGESDDRPGSTDKVGIAGYTFTFENYTEVLPWGPFGVVIPGDESDLHYIPRPSFTDQGVLAKFLDKRLGVRRDAVLDTAYVKVQ